MLRCLEAVAGHVEKGESPLVAAKRELKEEAGIEALNWEEFAKIEMSGSVFKSSSHLFLAKDLEMVKASPEEGEDISLVEIPLADAVSKVLSGEINHAISMVGILMLEKLMRRN